MKKPSKVGASPRQNPKSKAIKRQRDVTMTKEFLSKKQKTRKSLDQSTSEQKLTTREKTVVNQSY
jgi:hypothetical protein